MLGHQLITFWTTVYLLFNNVHVTKALSTRTRCQKDTQVWFCTDDKRCGKTYQSCVNAFENIDASVLIILIVFVVLILGISIASLYYLCIRRKQLTAAQSTVRAQSTTMGGRTQQGVVSYVDSDTSNSIQISIMESAPPPYDQNHRGKFSTDSENV